MMSNDDDVGRTSLGAAHAKMASFLDAAPQVVALEQAAELLDHAADCEACAHALRDRVEHAEALLDSLRVEPPADDADAFVVDEQREFRLIGKRIVGELPGAIRKALGEPLSDGYRSALWTLSEAPPDELRCALAVAEAVVMLHAQLGASRRGRLIATLADTGLEVDQLTGGAKRIGTDYVAVKLARAANTSRDAAGFIWRALLHVMRESRIGLPGVNVLACLPDGSMRVTIVDEPVPGTASDVIPVAAELQKVAAPAPVLPVMPLPPAAAQPPAAAARRPTSERNKLGNMVAVGGASGFQGCEPNYEGDEVENMVALDKLVSNNLGLKAKVVEPFECDVEKCTVEIEAADTLAIFFVYIRSRIPARSSFVIRSGPRATVQCTIGKELPQSTKTLTKWCPDEPMKTIDIEQCVRGIRERGGNIEVTQSRDTIVLTLPSDLLRLG